MWNVKEEIVIADFLTSSRINRNIVECKDKCTSYYGWFKHVLIETLWNVKEGNVTEMLLSKTVLIETLWNVKDDFQMLL